jgi:hypothetical protein
MHARIYRIGRKIYVFLQYTKSMRELAAKVKYISFSRISR